MSNRNAIRRLNMIFTLQYPVDAGFVNFPHIHTLSTAQDGRQNHVRSFGYQQKNRLFGWLLKQFQQLIGAYRVHFLGQPYNRNLKSTLTGFQTELLQDLIALFGINQRLRVLRIHFTQPMVEVKIRIVNNKWPPIGNIIIAHFFLSFRTFYDGEYEMHIRMYQLIEFHTRRTNTASIFLAPIGATDVACVCDSQWHFTNSLGTANELGMWNTPLVHFLNESLLDFFLSDYVSEKHINK